MKKKNLSQLVVSTLLCLVPLVLAAFFYSSMPEQVAIHFNASGAPDSWAPKGLALFGLPSILLAIHLFSWMSRESDPKRQNSSPVLRAIGRWLVPIISMITQIVTITYATGLQLEVDRYLSLALGVLLVVVGNYLPKCRQNYTIGIKLPWTLHSEENWSKTHRLAGWIWVAGGFFIIANAFCNIPWAGLGILLLLAVVPVLYSYLLYRSSSQV